MTDRFILLGHPVGHSVSPVIHQAAYEQLGRSASYALVDAPDEAHVLRHVERLRQGQLGGANVTVPWKQVALGAADRLDESARSIGAVNVLSRDQDGRVVGYNTDGLALADELERLRKPDARQAAAKNQAALVVGAGGAARAAVFACRRLGASPVYVTARRYDPAVDPPEWPSAAWLSSLGAEPIPWPAHDPKPFDEARSALSMIVQATSAGMSGGPAGEALAQMLRFQDFDSELVAYDLVYNPTLTPFVELARQAGHRADSGLGMLVGQAARAIEIWWGQRPELAPLAEAARFALGL